MLRPTVLLSVLFLLRAPAAFAAPPGGSKAPQVKLIDAGAEPRRVLLYKPTPGQKQLLLMKMKMTIAQEVAGQQMGAMKSPTITMPLDMTIAKVQKNGAFRYEFKMGKPVIESSPELAPAVVEKIKAGLERLEGVSGYGVATPQGHSLEAEVKLGANAPEEFKQFTDEFKQSLNQMVSPFPKEAIGKGARWTIKNTHKGSFKMEQTATMTLLSIEGDRGTIRTDMQQTAPKQQLQAPNLPPGAKVMLTSYKGSGGGERTFDLGKLAPSRAQAKITSKMGMDVQMGKERQPSGMTFEVDMEIAER